MLQVQHSLTFDGEGLAPRSTR